jgi:hypothetical protein
MLLMMSRLLIKKKTKNFETSTELGLNESLMCVLAVYACVRPHVV